MSSIEHSDEGGELLRSPKFAPTDAGAIKREPAIWSREQFGPWGCDVRVIPITGVRAGAIFEVHAHWTNGPGLDPELGPTPAGGMEATDQYVVDGAARDMAGLSSAELSGLAIELGKRSADLLADGVRPDLALLARKIRNRLRRG